MRKGRFRVLKLAVCAVSVITMTEIMGNTVAAKNYKKDYIEDYTEKYAEEYAEEHSENYIEELDENTEEQGLMAFNTENDYTYIVINGKAVIKSYTGNEKYVEIPSVIGKYKVSGIAEGVFKDNANIEYVVIPTVMKLGDATGNGCFEGCTNLKTVIMYAESSNDAENVYDEVQSDNYQKELAGYIGNQCFKGCTSLEDISVPGEYTTVGTYAFADCTYLRSFSYGENINSSQVIEEGAFAGCVRLGAIQLADTVTSIGKQAFYGCNTIESITLPKKLVTLGAGAFESCINLENVVIGACVTEFGECRTTGTGAFENCVKLSNVTIEEGNSEAIIGTNSFRNCRALTEIVVPANYTTIRPYSFYDCLSLTTFKHKIRESETSETSKTTEMSKISEISSSDDMLVIGYEVFRNCESLTDIELTGVKSIGEKTFYGCRMLTEITIPANVTLITGKIFDDSGIRYINNESKQEVNLPEIKNYCWCDSISGKRVSSVKEGTVYAEKKLVGTTYYNGIDYSDVYNADDYAYYNPDVVMELGTDGNVLIWHFVNYGMAEGRIGKKCFNVVEYMYGLLNDDLRAAFGGNMENYYYHYIYYGKKEGRSISDYDGIFDAEYYLNENPDVYENIVSRYTADGNTTGWALWHYYEYGMNEGRRGSGAFGVLNYEAANKDIWQAYGENYRQATIHYLQFGNGRDIIGKYDMYTLDETRPDVVEIIGADNPQGMIEWYIKYGQYGE